MDRGESCFVIDFSKTGFIDSSGLGVLISILKRITARGGNGSRCARNVARAHHHTALAHRALSVESARMKIFDY
jgi:anti-anti-sigma regulatory factor